MPFIDIGAPTWNSQMTPVTPFNTAHGWSASVNSLIAERIIGLRPARPGWKGISLDLPSGLLADYTYSLDTPAGKISVQSSGGRLRAAWPRGIFLKYGGKKIKGTGKLTEL
jgi:hypothetical protein